MSEQATNQAPDVQSDAVDANEIEQSQEQQAQSKQPEQMTQEELEEFVLKVNGREVKEKVNLKDKDRIKKALQMEKAAQEAFEQRAITAKELAEIQQNLDAFFHQFTTDPVSVIMNPDLNLSKEQRRQLAEAILKQDLEESQKTPEQLKLEETERRYQELLREKEAMEEQRQLEEQSRLEAEAARQLENEINEAISTGELPKAKLMNKQLVDLAYIAYANGVDISLKEILPFIKNTYKDDARELLSMLSDDEVEEIVSKDRIRSIRNKQIQSVKPKIAPQNPLKTVDTGVSNATQTKAEKLKAKDFFKKLGSV
jgi:hypothetical protein